MVAPDTSGLKKDKEWLALIAQLRKRKPLLIADFVARFPTSELYEGRVSDPEIDALIASTMEMYLVLLCGEPLSPALQRLPEDLGRRRAQQGVPASLLLEGVRTNSRVIWNALRELASDDSAAALVRNTDAVLSLVEWHVREVQSAYLREEEALNRHSERRRQRVIARLFDARPLDRDDVAAIAVDLGLERVDAFEVAVQLGTHHGDCALCRSKTAKSFHHEMAEGTCHIRPASADGGIITELSGCHAAVISPVAGLAHVGQAAQACLSLVHAWAARAPEPVTPATAWPAVAWRSLNAAVPADYLPINLGGLTGMPVYERQRLVETVRRYLDTGSIKATADALYCHRNTIVKRLARFQELTDVDLRIPRDAALVLLALTGVDT
ncbi:helix-turn-helix domain-containing protein [Streptomyces sp. NPDC056291]|uniref:PucR family transcriptional regulator n=1 Tax=unclassified Streptomyces TaxID=2593676 RepID=UPI0035DC61A7